MEAKIPEEVKKVAETLTRAGYEAYLVGGCVRDLLLGRVPKDWDITTNAKPDEIQTLFPESVYENNFGTVGVKTESTEPALQIIEITTYRLEGKYTDKRHPDEIKFAKTLEEDLSRRDFTVNAMALSLASDKGQGNSDKVVLRRAQDIIVPERSRGATLDGLIVDPFGGQTDLKNKTIRAVGNASERFTEDALRLLRAIRFAAQLSFKIEDKTEEAMKKNAALLEMISKERIRDEFSKLIMTDGAGAGIRELQSLGLLKYIIPELEEGLDMAQNLHHIYTVFEHNVRALEYTVTKNYPFDVRLASLLHDVGKSRTKGGTGKYATFYNHEVVGARMTLKILDRLRFSKETIEYVTHLVRHHLFYYNVGEVSEAGVRRFLARVGPENIDDLLKVREADRIGSGVPKAFPYKLRHLLFMIEKVKRDPISPKALKINGDDLMKDLSLAPGPRIGGILGALLEEVLDDPKKNTREALLTRAKELVKLSDAELKALRQKSEDKKEEFESGVEAEIKKKFKV